MWVIASFRRHLLFTGIEGSTALYQRVGDLNAFQLVQRHLDWLREATVWGTVGRWRGRSATR